MSTSIEISVGEDHAGHRLDKVLSQHLPDMSRSRIQALIKEGYVVQIASKIERTIKAPSNAVKHGELYRLNVPAPLDAVPQPEDIDLPIVFEDDHLVVVNKPAGMVVHPAPGSPNGTMVNALLHHCKGSLSGIGGVIRPGIVHRIDKDTSGLLVVAKHDKAHTGLSEQFAAHSVERRYRAVCKGMPAPGNGRIEGNIGRNVNDRKKMAVVKSGGKAAVTHYRILETFSQNGRALASHIECQLETGRTHQVRVHMMHIGHPLVGDPLYTRTALPSFVKGGARDALSGFKRQALHAKSLGFDHPITGEPFKFDSELPYDFSRLLAELDQYKLV